MYLELQFVETAGVMMASVLASVLPLFSKRCTAPRGMQSVSPGRTSIGVPSTVKVSTPAMP